MKKKHTNTHTKKFTTKFFIQGYDMFRMFFEFSKQHVKRNKNGKYKRCLKNGGAGVGSQH